MLFQIINKDALKEKLNCEDDDDDIHEDAAEKLKNFIQKYDKEIKKFGLFRRPIDSKNYLLDHTYLVCEETANHLVLWCLDLAMEEVSYDINFFPFTISHSSRTREFWVYLFFVIFLPLAPVLITWNW